MTLKEPIQAPGWQRCTAHRYGSGDYLTWRKAFYARKV